MLLNAMNFLRWLEGKYLFCVLLCIVHFLLMSCRAFTQIANGKKKLETVRGHRQQYCDCRASVRHSKQVLNFHVTSYNLASAFVHECGWTHPISFLTFIHPYNYNPSAHPHCWRWSRVTMCLTKSLGCFSCLVIKFMFCCLLKSRSGFSMPNAINLFLTRRCVEIFVFCIQVG
jgi:hypothetical protein